ncbi:hypothetical protein [Deinococcus sonorensis]|uniref:Uncharacterized protein n=1 Tax=Deinococcus sonorensis TaxID=309891 RepID=A0ABV8YA74_9DEIO
MANRRSDPTPDRPRRTRQADTLSRRVRHDAPAQQRLSVVGRWHDPPSDDPTTDTHLVGLSFGDATHVYFEAYPHQGRKRDALLHAYHALIERVPPVRLLDLSTPHHLLWDDQTLLPETRALLSARRSVVRARRPAPLHGHPGELAATLAARGRTGPGAVNRHLYTTAFTDGSGTYYVAGLLYGPGTLHCHHAAVQIEAGPAALDQAELTVVTWGFAHVPPGSRLMVVSHSRLLQRLWTEALDNTDPEHAALLRAARPLGTLIRDRRLAFIPDAEAPEALLMQGARELAGRCAILRGEDGSRLARTP